MQTVPRDQGGREMDTTASSLWLSPPGPSTTLCHTAGLQQDGDRVLHASACGQGNGPREEELMWQGWHGELKART